MTDQSRRRAFLKATGVGILGSLAGCTRGGDQSAGTTDGSGGDSTTSSDGGSSGGSDGSSGGGSSDLAVPLSEYENADIDWTQFEGKTINIGAVKHPWVDGIKPAVPVFEELTGIDVEWNILPEQEFRTKRLTDVSTGAGKFDLFFMDQVVNQFRQSGWLQPLDPYFDDDSLFDEEWYDTKDVLSVCRDASHGAGRADVWTGIPITVEVLTTFYRKDLYDKYDLSVPETLDELENNIKVIDEKEDGVVGTASRGQKGYGMNIYIQNSFIREYGKLLWDDFPTDSALDTEEAINAGQYYVDLLQNYGPSDAATQTWSDVLSTMQSGKTGHITADANMFWGGLTDPDASKVTDTIGIAKMPVPQTDEGRFAPNAFTWQVSTSKNAENSKAGFLFLVFASSKPTLKWLHEEQGAPYPVRESIWSSDKFKQQVGEDYADVSLESLKSAILDPFDSKYPEWGQKYSEQLQQAIAGNKSVDEAFKQAAKQAENIAGN